MNKIICLFVAACMLFALAGCANAGKTERAKIDLGESQIYAAEDRQEAVDYLLKKHLSSPAIRKVYAVRYAGDERSREEKAYYVDQAGMAFDEIIVFSADFKSARGLKAGAFNPNAIYTDYAYVLGRTDGGTWEYVTGGYA